MCPLPGALGEPSHVPVLTGGEKGAKAIARLRPQLGRGETDGVEAEREGFGPDGLARRDQGRIASSSMVSR